jgi:RNA polymerase-binding transcription factor DksA
MASTYPLDPRSAAAAQVRATLQARESALRAEVEAARVRGSGDPARVSREVMDREEQAEAETTTGINDAEMSRDMDELREISEALHRLDLGRYGLCKIASRPSTHAASRPSLCGALHRLPGQARDAAPAPA